MIRNRMLRVAIQTILGLSSIVGCNERVVEVAREAADRQAAQNEQMGELQQEVARGSRSLVEADAAARHAIVGVHRDLQAERRQLNASLNDLEVKRQQLVGERRTESLLLTLGSALGGLLLVVVLMGFLWQLLATARTSDSVDVELNQLLVEQLLGAQDRDPDSEVRKVPAAPVPATQCPAVPKTLSAANCPSIETTIIRKEP
jgi:hypothetical protein